MAKVGTTGARAAETRATAIPSLPLAAPTPSPVATPTPPPTAPPACAAATFGGILPTRVSQVIVHATEPQQLAPATPNPGTITGECGAVIVAGTQTIGYIRLAINYQGQQYTIRALVDASCNAVSIGGPRGATAQLGNGLTFDLGGQRLTTTVTTDSSYAPYASVR